MKIGAWIPEGLGGTQKAAWMFADGLASCGMAVQAISMDQTMRQFDVRFERRAEWLAVKSEAEAISALVESGFDAIHIHVPGYSTRNPIYPVLLKKGRKRPRVIETNVFGWLADFQANSVTDARLFISLASGSQALRRAWRSFPDSPKSGLGVVRYPWAGSSIPTTTTPGLRQRLSLPADSIVCLRVGRPDPLKWRDWDCRAFQKARETNARLQLVLMEPSEKLRAEVECGRFGPGIYCLPIEKDQHQLDVYFQDCDILLHASVGESFGYVIAEAMGHSKPVVTRTTPAYDNAQVELVENGVTGWVCASVEGLAAALRILGESSTLRREIGASGRSRIEALCGVETECALLADWMQGHPESQRILHRHEAWRRFHRDFPGREWDTIESRNREDFPTGGCLLRMEKLRSRICTLRTLLTYLKACIRARLGLAAFPRR